MYNISIVAGKTSPDTQASSRSCAMKGGVVRPRAPVPFKRERNAFDKRTASGTSEDVSVPHNKRHRLSCSPQALEAGENSPRNIPPLTNNKVNNHGAAFNKPLGSGSASWSTDQLYQSGPDHEAGQVGPSPPLVTHQIRQVHQGEQHIGQHRPGPFVVSPGQHCQSPSQSQPLQSQVYGIGTHPPPHALTYHHPVGFHGVGSLDFPAKQPLVSTVASSHAHQSHDVAHGLQTVGSQPSMYYRHQHEALHVQRVGPETGGLECQRLSQFQQPIQKAYQNPDNTTFSFHPTHGDHGGLGLNAEYQFHGGDARAANVASGHGASETSSHDLETFPSASYNTQASQVLQASGGQPFYFVNQQIAGGPPSTPFNFPPYPQPAVYSPESVANQNFGLPPSRSAYNPGSIDLGANPSYYSEAHFFHSTNPPQSVALMGGGEYYPGGGGSTSAEETATAALLGLASHQQNDPSPEQSSLNVSLQSIPVTSEAEALSSWSRSSAPSADGQPNDESFSGVKEDSSSIETDIKAREPRPEGDYSTEVELRTDRKVRKSRATGPTRRRRLRSKERAEAALTRFWGACLTCHVQKEKCEKVEDDRDATCKRCRNISKDSKKAIHSSIPCLRLKPQEIVLYRSGGLELTQRWKGVELKDIGAAERRPDIRVIHVSQGLFEKDHVFKVVAFDPRESDKVYRVWTHFVKGKEVQKRKMLKAYCFESVHETLASVEEYTVKYAIPAMDSYFRKLQQPIAGFRREPTDVIGRTFMMAINHYISLSTITEGMEETAEVSKERILLGNLFIFWFALRHTTGSFWITGTETLDMEPERKDQSYPLLNKVSAPRMIVAQFDSVNHKILEKYKGKVLAGFLDMVTRSSVKPWLTLYLVMFIILHETSNMCKDRYRHARQNYGSKIRYSIPHFVEGLQKGCNNLLSYWHYYNWRDWPETANYDKIWKTHIGYLETEQRHLVMETRTDPEIVKQLGYWKQAKANNGKAPSIRSIPADEKTPYTGPQFDLDWEHPKYWIAQIFEDKWSAHPTYQREVVPEKK